MKTRTYIALLSAAIGLTAQAVVQIVPAGEFAARDGRPGPGKKWKLSDEAGRKLAASMTAEFSQTAFNFDYEHQSLSTEKNGQPAPASGWATTFEWRPGEGLFATDVKWTEKARLAIEADEYRYISPVLLYDKATGEVNGVLNAAITNNPGLLGMKSLSTPAGQSLSAALAAQFTNDEPPELSMSLKELLIAALGLKTDITENDLVQAVVALKTNTTTQPAIPQALATALSVKPDTEVGIVVTAVEALKAKAANPDATSTAAIAALNAQIAELKKGQSTDSVAALVEANLGKKLSPALKEWALDLGGRNLAALKQFIDNAPDLGVSDPQSKGKDPQLQDASTLNAEEKQVCAQLSISHEDFIKTRNAQAAA